MANFTLFYKFVIHYFTNIGVTKRELLTNMKRQRETNEKHRRGKKILKEQKMKGIYENGVME